MFSLFTKTNVQGTLASLVLMFIVIIPLLVPIGVSAQEPSSKFGQFMGSVLLNLASSVTWLGGMLLQESINKFILGISDLLGNNQPLGAMIANLWVLVRDICNLIFIFGFVYIGIRTIIDADDSNTKRMLASLIIGALLINFSLYFTKAVIDVSNYTAVEIYNAAFVGQPGDSLSAKFAQSIGILQFYEKVPQGDVLANMTRGGAFAFYFMAALLLIVAGFVFASGAVLILTRFVALVFIMVFSPLLFAGIVFPQTTGQAQKLARQLFNYAFFAPAYLILLLVSMQIIGATMRVINKNGGTLSGALNNGTQVGQADAFGVILVFVVGIMFLIFSLKAAHQFGIFGADKAMAIGNNIRGRLQGAIGRNTVGRASSWALKKYEKDDARIGKMKGVRGAVLKTIRGGLTVTGADQGIRDTLKAGKTAKFGGEKSYEDDKKETKDRNDKRVDLLKADDFDKDIKEGLANPNDQDKKIKMERAIMDASIKQLEGLDQKVRKSIVQHMTQSQMDGLDKSTELSEADKKELGEARQASTKLIFDTNRDSLTKASVDQLNTLGAEYLKEDRNAVRLNSSQMDDLKKKMTPTEYKQISEKREAALEQLAQGGPAIDGKDKNFVLNQKAGELAKMPKKVLLHIAPELPIAALVKITQDGTLNKVDQAEVRQTIVNEAFAQPNNPHISDLMDWLTDSPIGKQFGV